MKFIILFSLTFTLSCTIFAQWTQQNSNTNQDFWGVSFANEDTGFAGGGPWQFTSSCVVARTNNGGEEWEIIQPFSSASCIFGITALNEDTVFAVGCNAASYYGLILKSIDGGDNWTVTNKSNTYGFYCVEFPINEVGFTCGWNGRIYKTINCGDTWTLTSGTGSLVFRRMSMVNENLGFAACGNDHASTNKIYKTNDGQNWLQIKNFNDFIIGGMHFFDENTGIIVGTSASKAAIRRTTDGGENWEDVLSDNYNFVLENLHFEGQNGWTAGKYGSANGIFRTNNGGQTWYQDFDELTGTPYGIFQYDNVIFAVGTGGMIFKNNLTNMLYVEQINVSGENDINSITVQDGTLQIIAEVLPEEATDKNVTWTISEGSDYGHINSEGILTATNNGTLRVRATANDGSEVFGETDIEISNQNIGVENIKNKFSICPNPSTGIFIIKTNENYFSEIEITDITGKIIKQFQISERETIIDLKDRAVGVYFIRLKSKNSIFTEKIIIE